ncbi:MAG: HK97-gp10 family putative phage morphogenesis protein [Cytophagaceae bacterium]|jgi:HK97 gp10 family phage protein
MAAEIYFDVKGIEEAKKLLQGLTPRLKAKVLKKAFEKAADPLIAEIKANVPIGESGYRDKKGRWHHINLPYKRYSGGKVVATYMPGNLKKSIGKIWGKGTKSYLRIGPRAGMSRANDGYYGHMIERGTKHNAAQPYMRPAAIKMAPLVKKSIADDVIFAIRKWRDR